MHPHYAGLAFPNFSTRDSDWVYGEQFISLNDGSSMFQQSWI